MGLSVWSFSFPKRFLVRGRRASYSDQTGGYDRREAATPAKSAKKRSFMTWLGQSDSMDHRVDGSAAGNDGLKMTASSVKGMATRRVRPPAHPIARP
jgi:hypothetical protein